MYIVLLYVFLLPACSRTASRDVFTIVSASENESLESIIEQFERDEAVRIEITYKGSVQMMQEMGDAEYPYDAVWPANSLWISLGDKHRRIKHVRSIMSSPVVFGIRESMAQQLGFVGTDVTVADILDSIRGGDLAFMMTSASQSNSGASAYLGFLYALSGNPDVLMMDDLADESMQRDIQDLLAGIHRSSGSSAWLKEVFVESDYDAMVNTEALLIEVNRELTAMGREPLHVIYPVDGIVIADSPLGYVNNGDRTKEELFLRLQEYLLSDEIQDRIGELGRRTGFGSVSEPGDESIFNPQWGIRSTRIPASIRLPSAAVIYEALRLYQSEFRKPSYTVYALDFSGSMVGDGETELKEAMRLLLDQQEAQHYLLQAGGRDETVVLLFANEVLTSWHVSGNDPEELYSLYTQIQEFQPDGGTNLYAPVIMGLDLMTQIGTITDYVPAIILMTDGEHTASTSYEDLARAYDRAGLDVPVFAIMFGNALATELSQITQLTRARLFDGRDNLIQAFRSVKGYN